MDVDRAKYELARLKSLKQATSANNTGSCPVILLKELSVKMHLLRNLKQFALLSCSSVNVLKKRYETPVPSDYYLSTKFSLRLSENQTYLKYI